MNRKVQDWKKSEVKNLKTLMENNKTVALCSLHKVRASQIQELRKKFRNEVILKCVKNNLVRLALKEGAKAKPTLGKLEDHIGGSSLLVLSNTNPFKLSFQFQKNKVSLSARAGDIAINDVVIPEGNTGIPPGPVISEFSEMGLPNKIDSGSICITKDTVIAKKGQPISGKIASLLTKLNIKPMEGSLILNVAYDSGLIHLSDVLQLDLETIKNDLSRAASAAVNLAFNSGYPVPEIMPALLSKATLEAKNLMRSAMIFDKEIMPLILSKCHSQALAVSMKLEKGTQSAA